MTDNPQQPTSPHDQPDDQPLEPGLRTVSSEQVEALLADGEISTLHGSMLWGSNYAALVTVSRNDLRTIAVYKPQRGERSLWDFPDGTLCKREVAAYVVSQALGWQLVPPTVLRQGPHGLGSIQLFIEHDPEINYFSLDDRFVLQLQRFAIFDALVNNADRKGGHLLLDSRGKLWGIDHGLTFHNVPKLRTVIWEFAGHRIADDLLEPVQRICDQLEFPQNEIADRLQVLLQKAELAAFQRRAHHILRERRFASPGPGPNHPWPPV
jgi:hypothetical protein